MSWMCLIVWFLLLLQVDRHCHRRKDSKSYIVIDAVVSRNVYTVASPAVSHADGSTTHQLC